MDHQKDIYDSAELIRKSLLGQLGEEEGKELDRLLENEDLDRTWRELQDPACLKKEFENYDRYPASEAYALFMKGRKAERTRLIRRLSAVAAVCALMLGSLVWWSAGRSGRGTGSMDGMEEVLPGGHKACLILTDGREVEVSRNDERHIREDGVEITYRAGKLVYALEGKEKAGGFNTLVVPRGGECGITLEDGSQVWLNAESRLKYPVAFNADVREIELEGEAYFKVKQDERPFVVKTSFADVKVLGTVFGVTAYQGGDAAYTTLVRGKVAVGNAAGRSLVLGPGQQARAYLDGKLECREVDVMEYVGWREGIYLFKRQSLEEIMSILGRWYDVDIEFGDKSLKDLPFTGSFNRYDNIRKFFDALDRTGDIRYRMEGRKIILYR